MKLSLIIEAIAKGRGIDQTSKAMGGLDRSSRRSALGIAQADRAMTRAERSATRLERAGYRIGHGIGRGTRQAIGGLIALERRMTLTQAQAMKLGQWGGRQVGAGLRMGAFAATGGALAAAYKVASAGMQFEGYQTQLTGLEGSAAAGQRAMDWVSKFAATTPYELDQVMEAFIALKAYGIDPTDGSLRLLGDTAAGMGKPLMQAIEMMADAQTGEFERLKEFGIRARTEGQRVTFTYVRNGQQITRVAKNTGSEIQRTLEGIFGERFSGGMDRLSRTTAGKWSNLMDQMTATANRVWVGGAGAAVNRVLDTWLSKLNQMEADGSLQRWAEDTGAGVGKMIDKFAAIDWDGIGADVSDIGDSFRKLADAIEKVGTYGKRAGDTLTWISQNGQKVGGLLNGWRMISNPVGALIDQQMNGWGTGARSAPLPKKPAGPGRLYQGPFLDAPPAGRAKWPAGKPTQGKILLEVVTEKGTSVKPKKVSSTGGLQIEVATGKAMAGAA